jgi:hypothetical protein
VAHVEDLNKGLGLAALRKQLKSSLRMPELEQSLARGTATNKQAQFVLKRELGGNVSAQ